ncbi:hypothetical protein VTJ04DRAFT_3540 [Mycothermus thermophilus]|uniref:uncharacterized protein n=1 Tax=Humicola insolens TaxID=85995 RepID=UPI0037435D20
MATDQHPSKYEDVFEDGDASRETKSVQRIRANSTIMQVNKILVANRGEISIRIFRTAHELSLHTIAVFSYDDRLSMHRQKADEAYVIGKRGQYTPVGAYLAGDEIIKIALEHGAQMIHPGYGFLSENADFARAVEKAGLIFIGPTPETIEALGDKVSARKIAIAAGVPVVPGTDGPVETFEEVKKFTDQYGFPIIIKAAYGGGGRGMRVVREADGLKEAFERATSEAKTAFGNGTVFVERFLDKPKHIEVQLVADNFGNVVHLYERDCSVQRRHQKVVEIAPAKDLPVNIRDAMLDYAVRIAKSVKLRNVATAEFLVDDKGLYFIEVNPRIQVEHTITEMVTGIDIVAAQIQIAAGASLQQLGLTQDRISTRGFAIQTRITTEDPAKNFQPDTGKIEVYRSAGGNGVRLDGGNGFAGAVITHDPSEPHQRRFRASRDGVWTCHGKSQAEFHSFNVLFTLSLGPTEPLPSTSQPPVMAPAMSKPAEGRFLEPLPDYAIWLIWRFLANTKPVTRSPEIQAQLPDISTSDLLEEYLEDAGFEFNPDVLEALQSLNPPSIDLSKQLSRDPGCLWGVYSLLLEKAGARPILYVGSGTHFLAGVSARWADYDAEKDLPSRIQKALNAGYKITNKLLLAWAPRPPSQLVPGLRHVFKVIENTFTLALGAMETRTGGDQCPVLCPWAFGALEWDGACSHHALYEGIRIGGWIKVDREEYQEWFTQRQAERDKERYQELLASGKFECEICGNRFAFDKDLQQHLKGNFHLFRKLGVTQSKAAQHYHEKREEALANERWPCKPCGQLFGSVTSLRIHEDTQKHLDMVFGYREEHPDEDVPLHTAPPPREQSNTKAAIALRNQASRNLEAKRYYCGLCDRPFRTAQGLDGHLDSSTHRALEEQAKKEGRAFEIIRIERELVDTVYATRKRERAQAARESGKWTCEICPYYAEDKAHLRNHFKRQCHIERREQVGHPAALEEELLAEKDPEEPPAGAEQESL